MRRFLHAAILAFGVTGALAAAPAGAQYYDPDAYGGTVPPVPAYDSNYDLAYDQSYDPYLGYCDPGYDCPDDYYDLPLYYGDVSYGGSWYNGPFYWRDYGGRRQYWLHGGWRYGNNRGGHFGPALGRDFYRSHGFGGRSFTHGGNWGGQDYARHAYNPPSFGNQSFGGFGNRNWNRGGGWNRQGFQGNQNFQAQRFGGTQNWGNHNWNRGGFSGGGRFQGRSQPSVQSTPQQNFGGGWRGGDHGGWRSSHIGR